MEIFGINFPATFETEADLEALKPHLITKNGNKRSVVSVEAATIPPFPTRRIITYLTRSTTPMTTFWFISYGDQLIPYKSTPAYLAELMALTPPVINKQTALYFGAMLLETLKTPPDFPLILHAADKAEIRAAFGINSEPVQASVVQAGWEFTGFMRLNDGGVVRCSLKIDTFGNSMSGSQVWELASKRPSTPLRLMR